VNLVTVMRDGDLSTKCVACVHQWVPANRSWCVVCPGYRTGGESEWLVPGKDLEAPQPVARTGRKTGFFYFFIRKVLVLIFYLTF